MPAGFQSFNDYGSVLIDDTDFNLVLVAKGTANTGNISPGIGTDPASGGGEGGSGVDSNFAYVGVQYTGTSPVIVVRGPSGVPIFPLDVYQNGTADTLHTAMFFFQGTTARTIEYWIFDRVPTNDPLPTFGLVVRNEAGQVTYHSDAKAARVDALLQLTQGNANAAVATDPARSYGVAFGAPDKGGYYDGTFPTGRGKKLGVEIVPGAAQLYIRPGNYWNRQGSGGGNGVALLVDVTNY